MDIHQLPLSVFQEEEEERQELWPLRLNSAAMLDMHMMLLKMHVNMRTADTSIEEVGWNGVDRPYLAERRDAYRCRRKHTHIQPEREIEGWYRILDASIHQSYDENDTRTEAD